METILPVEQALLAGARWLIRLRWFAATGVGLATVIGTTILHLPLPTLPLALTILWIVAYNAAFLTLYRRADRKTTRSPVADRGTLHRLFNAQIVLDWISLTAVLHYSGGLDNPFLVYFIFHAIIASILLPRWYSVLHVTLPILLVTAMGIAEARGWIPHVSILGPYAPQSRLLLVSRLVAFATTMYIAVYLTTEIASILRKREEEMARLEESLQVMNAALLDNDRIRSEYVLRVSHDLQSPLSAAYSMLDLVWSSMGDRMPMKGRDFLERSLRRLEALMRFARELHEISRIRAARSLAAGPIGLRSVIEAAAEAFLSKAREQVSELSIDLPATLPFVLGDRDHLKLALVELLSNATQYSPHGAQIGVHARATGGMVEIEVDDAGIGIPREEMPRIFDEFFRGAAARELQPHGWGLGLALVYLIVDRHGGHVRVDSEPGRGTRVVITLPAHRDGSSASRD